MTLTIENWRRAARLELRKRRLTLPETQREAFTARIAASLAEYFPGLRDSLLGFYWPFRGEADLCDFVADLVERGARAALPVVIEKNAPIEFWSWRPGEALTPGVWRIPVPAKRQAVRPDILLVPLLGFDRKGYRLGNGGGYYDRSLAAMTPKPETIGVGFECARLDTIYPCAHDVPMDSIVTEDGVWFRHGRFNTEGAG